MKTKPDLLVINQVMPDMIREENYQGEPHYMIASATMPDDIVMNGLLYPAAEIEASYMGLNGVHAPLGHPMMDGEFVSASTPYAVRNYGVGAQVANVRRENGRVLHDTAVNIAVANQTDRGKRLLDRIEAMKNGDNTKPIHTSTGVYLKKRELDQPQTNQYGEYYGIASDYVFDHNAILLDEVGAATPNEGTGMFVNSGNEKVDVFVLNEGEIVATDEGDMYEKVRELSDAVRQTIKDTHARGENEYVWICDLHEGYVIAEIENHEDCKRYKVPYMIESEGKVTIGEMQEVKRSVVYKAVNSLVKYIKSMGFAPSIDAAYNSGVNNTTEVSDMTPEELKAALADQAKDLKANMSESLASFAESFEGRLKALETNAQAAEKAEKEALAEKLGLEADEVAGMSVNTLQKMAAKLESQDTGEYGERAPVFGANSSKGDDFPTDLSAWGK